jgi:protein-tyrosine phosphatase
VVTLDAQAQPVILGVKEYRYGFPDGELSSKIIQEVVAAAHWAYEQWKKGETVLVRCQAGANRSGLVMALVLMRNGLTNLEAIEVICSKRSFALSNKHFVKWLNTQ